MIISEECSFIFINAGFICGSRYWIKKEIMGNIEPENTLIKAGSHWI
jgi:hypothetical protein